MSDAYRRLVADIRDEVIERFRWVEGHADVWRLFDDGGILVQLGAALRIRFAPTASRRLSASRHADLSSARRRNSSRALLRASALLGAMPRCRRARRRRRSRPRRSRW